MQTNVKSFGNYQHETPTGKEPLKNIFYSVEFYFDYAYDRNMVVGVTLPEDNHSVEQAIAKAKEWLKAHIDTLSPVSVVNQMHALDLKLAREEV